MRNEAGLDWFKAEAELKQAGLTLRTDKATLLQPPPTSLHFPHQ